MIDNPDKKRHDYRIIHSAKNTKTLNYCLKIEYNSETDRIR